MAWATKNSIKLQSAPTAETFKDDDQAWELLDLMAAMAKQKGKSVPQIALRWLLQKPVVTSVVIGVKSLAHLKDNLGSAAADWSLTDDEMAKLDEASATKVPYPYEMVWRCQASRKRPRLTC